MFPNVTIDAARDQHFKTFVFNKYHDLFEHKEVVKYTIWFNNLSKNSKKTVVLDSLAEEFVHHKLIRSKVELVNAFSTFLKAKIKNNDMAYTVNIDEFLDVLSKSSRIIDMEKFDEIVDMENKLSAKTLLIHERRKLLLEFVVTDRLNRAVEERQKEKGVLEGHRKQIEDANRFVGKVEFDLYCMKFGNKLRTKPSKSAAELLVDTVKVDVDAAEKVLQPLELLLDPNVLAMAKDTRKILYEDTIHDRQFNNMLSPTKVSSAGTRRSLALKIFQKQANNSDLLVRDRRPATTPLPSTLSSSSPSSSSIPLPMPASNNSADPTRSLSHQSLSSSLSMRAFPHKSKPHAASSSADFSFKHLPASPISYDRPSTSPCTSTASSFPYDMFSSAADTHTDSTNSNSLRPEATVTLRKKSAHLAHKSNHNGNCPPMRRNSSSSSNKLKINFNHQSKK